jgi:hypothetical protein
MESLLLLESFSVSENSEHNEKLLQLQKLIASNGVNLPSSCVACNVHFVSGCSFSHTQILNA